MGVGTLDIKGTLSDKVVGSHILVLDSNLEEVAFLREGEDLFPDGCFALPFRHLSLLDFSADCEDHVRVLREFTVTILLTVSVSRVNWP